MLAVKEGGKVIALCGLLGLSLTQFPKTIYVWAGPFGAAIGAYLSGGSANRDHYYDFLFRAYEACQKLGHKVYFDYGRESEFPDERIDAAIAFNFFPEYAISHLRALDMGAKQTILFAWEPPTVAVKNVGIIPAIRLFDAVYTLYDDLVDNIRFRKFYEPMSGLSVSEPFPDFSERKLCTILSSPLFSIHPREIYSSRKSLVGWFAGASCEELDVWGRNRAVLDFSYYYGNSEGYHLDRMYKGYAPSKLETYKHYKFALCYENMRGRPGYITAEKFLFCFLAGCIPIYWGAENVMDYVPPNCFIDRRDFASDEELYQYLRATTKEDYMRYLSNAKRYMGSPWPRVFSHNNFVDIFIGSFDPGYDRTIVFTPDELVELNLSKSVMCELGHL